MKIYNIVVCIALVLAISQAENEQNERIKLSKRFVMGMPGFSIGPRRGTTKPTTTTPSNDDTQKEVTSSTGSTQTVSTSTDTENRQSEPSSKSVLSRSESPDTEQAPQEDKNRMTRMTFMVTSRPTWIGYNSIWLRPKWAIYGQAVARTRPSSSRIITVTNRPTLISNQPDTIEYVGRNDIADRNSNIVRRSRRSVELLDLLKGQKFDARNARSIQTTASQKEIETEIGGTTETKVVTAKPESAAVPALESVSRAKLESAAEFSESPAGATSESAVLSGSALESKTESSAGSAAAEVSESPAGATSESAVLSGSALESKTESSAGSAVEVTSGSAAEDKEAVAVKPAVEVTTESAVESKIESAAEITVGLEPKSTTENALGSAVLSEKSEAGATIENAAEIPKESSVVDSASETIESAAGAPVGPNEEVTTVSEVASESENGSTALSDEPSVEKQKAAEVNPVDKSTKSESVTTNEGEPSQRMSQKDKLLAYADELAEVASEAKIESPNLDISNNIEDLKEKKIFEAPIKPIVAATRPLEAAVVDPVEDSDTMQILEIQGIPKKMRIVDAKAKAKIEPVIDESQSEPIVTKAGSNINTR